MTKPLLLLALLLAAPAHAAAAPADDPGKLLDAYLKAKKPEEKAKAQAAIDAAAPLDPKEVKGLRDRILAAMAKAGRKVPPKGKNEWFDEATQKQKEKELAQKDVWKGLFFSNFDGKKGLVLGMHGGGIGAGDAGSAQSQFSGVVGTLGFSAVFPEVLVKTERGWTDPEETEKWVLELVRRARVSWGIDPNRIYATGHSMGGFGAWHFSSIHADAFAAGAAFAGAPLIYWKSLALQDKEALDVVEGYLPNLFNVRFFVYQSLDDQNVKAPANVFACAELKKLHEKEPEGWEYRYEEVDGLGHGFPKKGPQPGLEWATAKVRDPRPRKVVWQPTREWKNTFYWVRWEKPWLGALLTATVDKARNAVDITVANPRAADAVKTRNEREERLQGISVYLDERLLDPAKDVVLAIDGKERFRGRPEARLATLLRSCEEREDPEYGFAMEVHVGPPPPEPKTGGK